MNYQVFLLINAFALINRKITVRLFRYLPIIITSLNSVFMRFILRMTEKLDISDIS